MKHYSPGCATVDCCGVCWSCADPLALVLTGSTCCLAGSYAFGNYAPFGNLRCGAQYTLSQSVIIFRDTTVTVTGGGTDRSCCIGPSVVNTFICVAVCDTQSFADTIELPGTTLRGCHLLVLLNAQVTAYVRDVTGTPTVVVTLSRTYRWYANKASQVGSGCDSGLPSTIQYYEWVYDDSYSMAVNCADPTASITHTGRTLVSCTTNTGASATSYTLADDNGFTWGFNTWATPAGPVFRYDVCEPTAALSF